MSIDKMKWMKKKWYMFGILSSNKNKANLVICDNIDGAIGHFAK